jgi:hypothetical protein
LFYLARFEETAISILLRESGVAFFSSLSIHALAMALVVGINVAVCLQLLIAAPNNFSAAITRFYPLHWWGVLVIFLSGTALLIAYPAKALTNPVFYLKLAALTAALIIAGVFQRSLTRAAADKNKMALFKKLAAAALALWLITLFAGRFLAYTHSVLLASRYF